MSTYGERTISEGDEILYRAWCAERGLDPEDAASASAYEDWWFDHHGEE